MSLCLGTQNFYFHSLQICVSFCLVEIDILLQSHVLGRLSLRLEKALVEQLDGDTLDVKLLSKYQTSMLVGFLHIASSHIQFGKQNCEDVPLRSRLFK